MPIFEYKCLKCGAQFELLLRGKETPKCPECSSKRLEKLISTFSAGEPKSNGCKGDCTCGHSHESGHHCCGHCCCGH